MSIANDSDYGKNGLILRKNPGSEMYRIYDWPLVVRGARDRI